MEIVINEIKGLFSVYGLKSVIIILLTVITVNLIKKPIVKKFTLLAESNGYDKNLVTKNFTYVAFWVAILFEFITQIALAKFNFYIIDYKSCVSAGITYGGLAIALYETVKRELKAYTAKKTEN